MVFHTTKMQVPTGLNVHKVPLPQHHISKSLLWNSGEKKMEKENAETHKKIEEHKNEFNSDENHSFLTVLMAVHPTQLVALPAYFQIQ